jgi:hypothetical protein
MAQILQAFIAPLFPVKSPYRDQRGNSREQEERGKKASLNVLLQQAGKIIEHVGAEGNCET